jgi:N-acetylglucosamine-6-phosphate deacetylase
VSTIYGRVVTPDGVLDNGVVEYDGDRIVDVAVAIDPPRQDAAWILPGFVDIHVHGGGGHSFTTGDPEDARAAAGFHARHGTTTLLASLVTAPLKLLSDATLAFAPLIEEGILAGVHLEGPYLSPGRCGAQNPSYLRDPDHDELAELLAVGGIRMVTIAPERPDALDSIRFLRDRGVVAAIGHTDATYEQAVAGIEAGARVATHLFNAMRPLHHRDPGPVAALLESPEIVCEQIADGAHLHDAALRHVVQIAGAGRVALITDAMAAAGMPPGDYELGGQRVTVADGVARLAGHETIAGSTLTMDAAIRRTVQSGVTIVDAAIMASTTPAAVLGLGDRGALMAGRRADLVLLDDELRVTAVLRAGVRVPS